MKVEPQLTFAKAKEENNLSSGIKMNLLRSDVHPTSCFLQVWDFLRLKLMRKPDAAGLKWNVMS